MIEFDFDDVIVDCQAIVEAGILEETGVDVNSQRSKNFYVTVPGYTNSEVSDLVCEILLRDTHKMLPTEMTIESLERISHITKQPIRIITARQLALTKVTNNLIKELAKDKFKYEVIFSYGYKKSAFLKPSTRFFVDDLPNHVNDLAKHLDNVFMMNREWNKNVLIKPNIIRVENLQVVAKFIEKLL